MSEDRYKADFDELIEARKPVVIRRFTYGRAGRHVPAMFSYMWSKVGISSWADGTFRTCDPDMVWGAIEDALEGKSLLKAADCFPYAISAFGVVCAWNSCVGSIRFDFQRGRITSLEDPTDKDRLAKLTTFMTPFPIDAERYDDYDLYNQAVAKLGALQEDQIYSFTPIFPLGGEPSAQNLIVADAKVHLIILAQSQEFAILHFNSKRYPGGYKRME